MLNQSIELHPQATDICQIENLFIISTMATNSFKIIRLLLLPYFYQKRYESTADLFFC